MAGLTGEIFISTNGGITWKQQNTHLANRLNKVLMATLDTAYACGSAGSIFRSTDGGNKWDSLSSGIPYFIQNLFFIDSRIGYAIGDSGTILKTYDAGKTWVAQFSDTNLQLMGIDFIDSLNGAISGEGSYIYITSDGGKNWHRNLAFSNITYLLTSVTMHSLKRLTSVAYAGGFFESQNGGITWDFIHIPEGMKNFTFLVNGGFTKEKDKGLAVGFPGVIITSADSGKSWQQNASCPLFLNYMSDMHFFDSSNGYVVGGGTNEVILHTSNGGITWESLLGYVNSRVSRLFAPTPDTAIVLGDYGWLLKTTDGWKHSFRDLPPTIPGVNSTNIVRPLDISMVNRNVGFIVGDTLIWKTTDGCVSWSVPAILRNYYVGSLLTKVFFSSENVGYILGQYDIKADSGSQFPYNEYFAMFRTRDGGVHWDTLECFGRERRKQSVFFWDDMNGVVICDKGIIGKTSDGGDTWRQSYRIEGADLNEINFFDRKTGYISATPGKVFLTTDGGETWTLDLDLSKTYQGEFLRVIFPDSNTVMVSGYEQILKKKIDLLHLASEKTESKNVDRYAWITLDQNPVTTNLSCKLYWISKQNNISLKVYDILGRLVQDLTLELHQDNSAHGVGFTCNVSSLSNGVYLLVLDADGYSKSQNFVIAK